MSRETLLITGASGFIGQALLRLIRSSRLEESRRVVLLARHDLPGWETISDGRDKAGLFRFTRDDFERHGVGRIDEVIHLGAFIPKVAAESDNVAGSVANIVNSRHLLNNLPNTPRRLIFASTVDVYGASMGPVAEDQPCQPGSLYGQSKLFCEKMLATEAGGIELQILRIGHVYGIGEGGYRKFIPESIKLLISGGAPHFLTDGTERRSFLHVDDCCRLILASLSVPPTMGPITIASRTPHRLHEIGEMLCEISLQVTGRAATPTWEMPARIGRDMVFDVTKMEHHLGHERVSLADGLRDEFLHFYEGTRR